MSESYTEEHYENSLIELFEGMGYRHVYGPDVERDYTWTIRARSIWRSWTRRWCG